MHFPRKEGSHVTQSIHSGISTVFSSFRWNVYVLWVLVIDLWAIMREHLVSDVIIYGVVFIMLLAAENGQLPLLQ